MCPHQIMKLRFTSLTDSVKCRAADMASMLKGVSNHWSKRCNNLAYMMPRCSSYWQRTLTCRLQDCCLTLLA